MSSIEKAKLNIGSLALPYGLVVAPMAGISDRTFRRLCMEKGAEYSVSEMVCAKALVYEQRCKKTDTEHFKTGLLASVTKEDLPMAVQIFGGEPEFIAEATRLICTNSYKSCRSDTLPSAIDINMGCPVHKIVSNGEGSALMKDPDLAGRVAEAAVKAAGSIPVTAKIRAGWDKNSVNAVEVARILESAGVAAITVHGRTRSQMYSGESDNGIIALVKDAVKIPVIGNGDVTDGKSALKMIAETGCDGIMIGRGAIGNPWVFGEVRAALASQAFVPPAKEEIIDTALLEVKGMIGEKGEKVGIAESKKHLCRFIKGFRGACDVRGKLNLALTYEEIEALLRTLLENEE